MWSPHGRGESASLASLVSRDDGHVTSVSFGLARQCGDDIVCFHDAQTGSHIVETRCFKRSELEERRKADCEPALAAAIAGTLRPTLVASLGAAIGYYDLTLVARTSVGNGAPAVPVFLLTMVVYILLSLVASTIVNIANRRMALVER